MHIAGLSHTPGGRPHVTIGATPIIINDKEPRKKATISDEDDEIVILEKSNILMLGPTGSGESCSNMCCYSILNWCDVDQGCQTGGPSAKSGPQHNILGPPQGPCGSMQVPDLRIWSSKNCFAKEKKFQVG